MTEGSVPGMEDKDGGETGRVTAKVRLQMESYAYKQKKKYLSRE